MLLLGSDGNLLTLGYVWLRLMSKKIQKSNTKIYSTPVRGDFVNCKNNLFLYRFVYSNATSLLMSFLLIFSFFVQGVEKVYADETISTDEVVSEVEVEVEADPEPTPEPEGVVEETPLEVDVPAEVFDETDPDLAEEDSSLIDAEEDISEPETVGEIVLEEDNEPTDSVEAPSLTEEELNEEDQEETEEVVEVEEELIETNVTHEIVSVTESDSEFSFSKDECTQLATGSFYCHQPQENVLDDALFSAPDEDGDLEIFLVRDGIQTQVTSNSMDDASPYFDQNTDTLVWHRLIDDRYQIISFDVNAEKETQLTRTSENNMEPTRQGSYTVWQRWVDGGWNIILFDGDTESQITKTTSHNIAPYIHGSLVVWNRYTGSGDKTIEMYDIENETYVTVDDPDGMSVSNPRMVFVYDSLHPNGDIVTKGYDVLARKFIDLDTLPRNLPDELPASDSTGETRALIQSKPSLKSEVEEAIEGVGTSTSNTNLPPESVSTTTESLTLDLTSLIETEPAFENIETTSSTEFDLVIEPYIASSSVSEVVQE